MADNKQELVVMPLQKEALQFPVPPETVAPTFVDKIHHTIATTAVKTPEGKTALSTKGLATILCTDKVGAKEFYSDLDDADKFTVNNQHYIRTPALKKELDERIEKPYSAIKREQLRYNSECLSAVRDNQESERLRGVNEEKIRQQQKTLKHKKIARDGDTHCAHTGELLQADAQAHHKIRRADNPDKALDLDNINVVNPMAHQEHHKKEQEQAKDFGS
ncbi:hypothetical protein [Pantoea sp. Fr+CA_20]|uniref:hypothetical protein n=1 Tax=Pantoea sp. Fr+CA_20 TaxID=2929506 RepID=UPI0021182501|nr:hypothetical protein [Pantoea sp. Fr+CA_20]